MTTNLQENMKLLLLMTIFLSDVGCHIFQIQNTSDEKKIRVSNCVDTIISNYYVNETVIYMVNGDINISYPVVRQNLGQNSSLKELIYFVFRSPDMYLLVLRSLNITDIFNFLKQYRTFNPRAKFIILAESSENIDVLYEELMGVFVCQVIVIDSEGHPSTYDPYIYENVTETGVTPEFFNDCSVAKFKGYLPKLWRNTTVKVSVDDKVNIFYRDKNGVRIEFGSVILNLIKEKLEFNIEHLIMPLSKARKQLREGNIHVSNTFVTIQGSPYVSYYDLLATYVGDNIHWVVPSARPLPYWKAFFLSYSLSIWTLIGISLLLLIIFWYFLERSDLFSNLEFFFAMFLEVSVFGFDRIFKPSSSRILISTTLCSFLVISSCFKAEMIRIFVNRPFDHQINSFNEIIETKLECATDGNMLYALKHSEYFHVRQFANKCKGFGIDNYYTNDAFDDISAGKNLAFVVTRLEYVSYLNEIFIVRNKELRTFTENITDVSAYYLIPEGLFYLYHYLFITKGYPLRIQMQQVLNRLHEAGIIHFHLDQNQFRINQFLRHDDHTDTLSFEQISVGFYILTTGLVLSSITFVLELLIHYYYNSKKWKIHVKQIN